MSSLRPFLMPFFTALLVLFCFNWRPLDGLFVFYPRPLLIFAAVSVLLIFIRPQAGALLDRLLAIPARYLVAACAMLATGASLYLSYGPLEAIPHVPDDICYLWQARTFALGRLYVESHDLPEFFHLMFMVNDGKWYSLFQPGWPALLMLGVWPGIEYAINPILAGIAVALIYPIGHRALDDRSAKLGMLMATFSPMHVAICATLLAHSLTLVLTELAILFVFRLCERDRMIDTIGLATVLGWMFTTRALNAVAITILTGSVLLFLLVSRKVSLRTLLAGLPIAALFFGLQLAYNNALTGEPLYWPQDRYFDLTEPKKGCHRLGFGKEVGCPNIHGGEDFPQGFGPSDALNVTHRRLGTFLLSLLGWNVMLVFMVVPFFSSRFGWRKHFLLAIFLALLIAYFFFYFHGLWGRYYFEAHFSIFLLLAAGGLQAQRFLRDSERVQSWPTVIRRATRSLVPAAFVTYFFFNAFMFFPTTIDMLSEFFFGVDRRIENMTKDFPEKSVVFLETWYQAGFAVMRPDLPSKRLFVHDGGKHNRLIKQYYPDWHFFRYDPKHDVMKPEPPFPAPSPVHVEAEAKIITGNNSGDYVHGIEFKAVNGKEASEGKVFAYEASKVGAYVGFDQFIFADGDYSLSLQLPTGPDWGRMRLSLDGHVVANTIELYAELPGFIAWSTGDKTIPLTRGQHTFLLEALEPNRYSKSLRIGIDTIVLERIAPRAEEN